MKVVMMVKVMMSRNGDGVALDDGTGDDGDDDESDDVR
jgi:hypothetical protein